MEKGSFDLYIMIKYRIFVQRSTVEREKLNFGEL